MMYVLRLPEKHSTRWLNYFGGYSLALFTLMALTRVLLHVGFSAQAVLGVATLAILTGAAACLGGYWGARLLFFGTTAGAVVGLITMYHNSIFHPSPGWSDFSTIAGYVLLTMLGFVLGALADAIRATLSARRGKPLA